MLSGVIRQLAGSTSTNLGVAPTRVTASAVAMNELAGTSTSSPGPTSSARSASTRASVPEETPIACGAPQNRAKSSSKPSTASPSVKAERLGRREPVHQLLEQLGVCGIELHEGIGAWAG